MPVSLEIEAGELQSQPHQESNAGKENSAKKELRHELSNSNSDLNKKNSAASLAPLYQTLPAIPDDLRQEAFNSYAMARFYISSGGMVTNVELIKPCNNPKLNSLLLKSLKKWKFSAQNEARMQDIRVTFAVE